VPDLPHIRIYLDSNVFFSAAYQERNRFLQFWQLHKVTPVVSPFAMEESRRHAVRPGHAARLDALLAKTGVISDADVRYVSAEIVLAAKDRPILAAAIGASVEFLVTGDKRHFSHLYKMVVGGVYIASPTSLLDTLKDRLMM